MRSVWLMYHGLYKKHPLKGLPHSSALYHISETCFKEHLSLIRDSGLQVTSIEDFLNGNAKRDSVILTFDDGWRGALELGVPLLKLFGFKAAFFITKNFVGQDGFCDPSLIIEAAKAGMEIGIHGTTHTMLSSCNEEAIAWEFSACKEFLESLIHRPVHHASLPGGGYSLKVAAIARKTGLKSLCASTPGVNKENSDPFNLKRVSVRDTTSLAEMRRYLNFSTQKEFFRQQILQSAKNLLGMDRYHSLRKKILDKKQGVSL